MTTNNIKYKLLKRKIFGYIPRYNNCNTIYVNKLKTWIKYL